MKRSLLASVSVLALTVSASAAPPLPMWTGFYLGVNAGAAWHKSSYDLVDVVPEELTGSKSQLGGTVGGQLGYNWQLQNYVLGIEGDLNWVGSKVSLDNSVFTGSNYSSKLTWLSTIRGRAGTLVDPQTLLYLTGGLAVGGVQNDTNISGGFSDHKTKAGWTFGGGVERMLTSHWTAKAEALYVDLGSSSVQGFFGAGYTGRFTNTAVLARFGVNYKW
jgi:outer membrane immunogenic protein